MVTKKAVKKIVRKKPKLESTEITASYSGTIATGSYQNERPMFSIKETYSQIHDAAFVSQRQAELEALCYKRFVECEQRSIVDRIKKERADIRFYENKYPSVTSIINWDTDFFVPPDQLIQYAARGTIVHKQVEIFLKGEGWKDPKDIPEIYPELVIVKKGSLGLSLDGYNFPAFFEKYPFEVQSLEVGVVNEEHVYAGRCDIVGTLDGVKTVFDVKTSATIDKTKFMKQLTAYARCLDGVGQLCIIPLTQKNKCGFSAPVVEKNNGKYWSLFLRDRENFKKRFNV